MSAPHTAPDSPRELASTVDDLVLVREQILDAAERKVRAQRYLGVLLAVVPLHTGGRPGSSRSRNCTGSLKLGQLGLSKRQSADAQRLARIADGLFETYLATTRAAGRPASAAGAIHAAREAIKPPHSKAAPWLPCTRATRRFSSHLTAAKRLAREFGLDELVSAVTAATTFARQIGALVDPDPVSPRGAARTKGGIQ